MRILFAFLLFSAVTAFAEVSREDASSMIDEMVKSNMISQEEAAKAKARLQTMSATEWTALNKDAEKKAAEEEGRAPASIDNTDLSAEQFNAIESDLKKIAPHTVVDKVTVEPVTVESVTVEPVTVEATHVEEVKVSETYVPQT